MIARWVHPEYLLLKEKFEMWYDRTHPENWCLVRREYGHICGGRSWRRRHRRLVREMCEIQLSGWEVVRGAAAHFNTNMNPSRVSAEFWLTWNQGQGFQRAWAAAARPSSN